MKITYNLPFELVTGFTEENAWPLLISRALMPERVMPQVASADIVASHAQRPATRYTRQQTMGNLVINDALLLEPGKAMEVKGKLNNQDFYSRCVISAQGIYCEYDLGNLANNQINADEYKKIYHQLDTQWLIAAVALWQRGELQDWMQLHGF